VSIIDPFYEKSRGEFPATGLLFYFLPFTFFLEDEVFAGFAAFALEVDLFAALFPFGVDFLTTLLLFREDVLAFTLVEAFTLAFFFPLSTFPFGEDVL
jgi:hypothetical protein